MPFRTIAVLLCVLVSLSACANANGEAPDPAQSGGEHSGGGGYGGGGYGGA